MTTLSLWVSVALKLMCHDKARGNLILIVFASSWAMGFLLSKKIKITTTKGMLGERRERRETRRSSIGGCHWFPRLPSHFTPHCLPKIMRKYHSYQHHTSQYGEFVVRVKTRDTCITNTKVGWDKLFQDNFFLVLYEDRFIPMCLLFTLYICIYI